MFMNSQFPDQFIFRRICVYAIAINQYSFQYPIFRTDCKHNGFIGGIRIAFETKMLNDFKLLGFRQMPFCTH